MALIACLTKAAVARPVLLSAEARGTITSGGYYSETPYTNPGTLNPFSVSLVGLPISFHLTIWDEENEQLISGITGACFPRSNCKYKGEVKVVIDDGIAFNPSGFGYSAINENFVAVTGPGYIIYSFGEDLVGGAVTQRFSNDYNFLIAAESSARNVYWSLSSALITGGPGKMGGEGKFASEYFSDEQFSLDVRFSLHSGSVIGGSLAAVPEPSNWVMMITGFGLVGASHRLRGRKLLGTA
ncbi:PEPxxWA-CTERM sorting domain-containing protein [Sandarakinorhabdus rubra]|uniref:PEPxxWA-CTERM sorting domain-containing protein n=1 Tax=Sandarakinorhabdus rubra TaxID=2672568 RepID=UPI001F33F9A4|nr:PEPxxWA-CTERM sorting domain-containing protein [Sandarakinorhabdus rubra]